MLLSVTGFMTFSTKRSHSLMLMSNVACENALATLRDCAYHRERKSSSDGSLRRPLKEEVEEAMDTIERDYTPKTIESDIKGQYELVYSSLIPQGYFPIEEVCDFKAFTLTSKFGFLPLGQFQGESSIMREKPLEIEFYSERFKLGPLELQTSPKPRSYVFLYAGEDFAFARSKPSGGRTVLRRIS
jgi:hypothetical protein